MQSNKFTVTFNTGGTLGANETYYFQLRGAATLLEISAAASNDSDATLMVGTSGDTNGIVTGAVIGDSGTPTVWGRDDWDGELYTDADNINYLHFADNTIFVLTLDYDGAGGTAAANVLITMWFDEA